MFWSVSHDADIFLRSREESRDLVLHAICVLVFVDGDIAPAILQTVEHLRRIAQERECAQKKIVEIECTFLFERFFVHFPDRSERALPKIACCISEFARRYAPSFFAGDR